MIPPHWPQCATVPEDALDDAAGEADVEVELFEEVVGEPVVTAAEVAAEVATCPTVGVSPFLIQPVISVNAFGHVTFFQLTFGLSAPANQSKRQ